MFYLLTKYYIKNL